jgi:hypothetical protein
VFLYRYKSFMRTEFRSVRLALEKWREKTHSLSCLLRDRINTQMEREVLKSPFELSLLRTVN